MSHLTDFCFQSTGTEPADPSGPTAGPSASTCTTQQPIWAGLAVSAWSWHSSDTENNPGRMTPEHRPRLTCPPSAAVWPTCVCCAWHLCVASAWIWRGILQHCELSERAIPASVFLSLSHAHTLTHLAYSHTHSERHANTFGSLSPPLSSAVQMRCALNARRRL